MVVLLYNQLNSLWNIGLGKNLDKWNSHLSLTQYSELY